MRLIDIVNRIPKPEPWSEGERIPWDEPEFSRRMLREHLTQEHDLASRRFAKIDAHVAWIHHTLLGGRPSRVLDLGCGPGLYSSRLATLGHDCLGIDFSPASVAYATEHAPSGDGKCRYVLGDIRTAEYGTGYDLAMLIYGEFNTFRPAAARRILEKVYRAMPGGGLLLLEPETFAAVRADGSREPSWYAVGSGLFSERPHVCLTEHIWDPDHHVAITRFYIVDADGAFVTRHALCAKAYTNAELRLMLQQCGFVGVQTHPSLTGTPDDGQPGLIALVARRPA